MMFSKTRFTAVAVLSLIILCGAASFAASKQAAASQDLDWGDEAEPAKWHLTVTVLESYFYQPARQIETDFNDIYNLSAFSGLNTAIAVGGEYGFYPNWRLFVDLIYRQVTTTGNAVEAATGLNETFKLSQTFIGGELGVRYTLQSANHWSLLALAEYDKGTAISLTVTSGPPIEQTTLALPTYVIVSVGASYDFMLSDRNHLDVGLRGGMVTTTSPFSVVGDVTAGYRRTY